MSSPDVLSNSGAPSAGASEFLHRLRGLLALVVLVHHARQLLWVSYDALPQTERTLLHQGAYFFTAFGAGAVILFFVLSGYLITRLYARPLLFGGMGAGHFLGARAVRLYLVLVPTLLLSFVLSTTMHGLGRVDGTSLALNLAFLQPSMAPVFAENIPLWSLGYEGCAYLLFLIVVRAMGAKSRLTAALLWASSLLLVSCWGLWAAHYLLVWGLGAAAALLSERWEKRTVSRRALRVVFFVALGLTSAALIASRLGVSSPFREWIIALPAALAFASLEGARLSSSRRWGAPLSRLSYSLYLSHYPILLALVSIWGAPVEPSAGWLRFFGATALCLSVAWLFSQATERHTGRVRRALGLDST